MEDNTTANENISTRDEVRNTEGDAAMKKAVDSDEKARASRMKSGLCNLRLTSEDTKSVVRDMETTLTASATEIFDELMIVNAKVDETTMLDATLRIAVGCERTKAASRKRERQVVGCERTKAASWKRERQVAVVEAGIKERELKRWQKVAEDERKNLQRETCESVTTMAIDKQKLIVERAELKQENARLECDLDTARTALQAEKAKFTIKITDALIGKSTMEEKLASAERDRNAAALTVAQQKSQIIEKSNDIIEMHRYIDNVTSQKEKLAEELLKMKDEAAQDKKVMEASQAQLEARLEEALGDCKGVRDDRHQIWRKLLDMEAKSDINLSRLQGEKILLEEECRSIRNALCEEQQKSLCEICMDSQKDTICLPCLHLRYCFNCVEKHRERARTCPYCRTFLSGVLRSDLSM